MNALDDQEDDDQHPRRGRDEEREELALEDRPEASHTGSSLLVSSAKTCSSEALTGTSSRRPTPAGTSARATSSVAVSTSSRPSRQVTDERATARPRRCELTRFVAGEHASRALRRARSQRARARERLSLRSSSIVSLRDELALGDDQRAIAGGLDLGQDVRREQHRVLAAELADERADLADLVGIEPGGRLVENENGRLRDERIGEPHALAVALRKVADELARRRR